MLASVDGFIKEENLIEPGDHVAVALSGGPDSVALLHYLNGVKEVYGLSLSAIHINHGLRTASEAEHLFVQGLCESMGIPLAYELVDLQDQAYKGMSIEEAARSARYKVFDAYLEAHEGKIALGHHMDDQGETVLLNLFRGAGMKGLRGMLPRRGRYIRPLLEVDQADIMAYCKDHGLAYVKDESNTSTVYRRNQLRLDLMPEIERTIQPKLTQRLCTTAKLLREEEAYLEDLAAKAYSEMVSELDHKLYIDGDGFRSLPKVMQRRLLRLGLDRVRGGLRDVAMVHIEQLIAMVDDNHTGKVMHLPGGWQLRIDYQQLVIEMQPDHVPSVQEEVVVDLQRLERERVLEVGGYRLRLIEGLSGSDYPQNLYTKWLDYDKIGTNLILRTRRPGDWLRLGDTGHRKKLKNYFIDAKISRPKRDELMLLVQDHEVVWVIGHRMNAYYKVSDKTQRVLEVTLIKEEQQ